MAFWGTLLAVVLSVPVAWLAATTTTPSMIVLVIISEAISHVSRERLR